MFFWKSLLRKSQLRKSLPRKSPLRKSPLRKSPLTFSLSRGWGLSDLNSFTISLSSVLLNFLSCNMQSVVVLHPHFKAMKLFGFRRKWKFRLLLMSPLMFKIKKSLKWSMVMGLELKYTPSLMERAYHNKSHLVLSWIQFCTYGVKSKLYFRRGYKNGRPPNLIRSYRHFMTKLYTIFGRSIVMIMDDRRSP